MQDESHQQNLLAAPPTVREPVVHERRSAWPTVIGIIAIVFGSIGVLNGCMSAGSMIFMDMMADFIPDDEGAAQFEAMRAWTTILTAGYVIGVVLGGLIIAGGAGVLKRRRWGIKACVTWAILKIAYEIAMVFPTYQMQMAPLSAVEEDDPALAGMPAFFETMMLAGVLGAALIGVALPIFLLIWFSLPRIRRESAQWP